MPSIETKTARETLVRIFYTGFGVVVFGIVIAASTKPSVARPTTFDPGGPKGSQAAYDMGLVIAGIGSAALLVALVGYAVMLGIQAARD